MSARIPVLDLSFLLLETLDKPAHVAGLLTFALPPTATPHFVKDIVEAYRAATPLPPFNRVPEFRVTGMPTWRTVSKFDMEYHVQHLALPSPGTDAQLLRLVTDLHESVLDRHRPLFKIYVIEGLSDDRFAIYGKVHHALVDGQAGMIRIIRSLTTDPRARSVRPMFALDLADVRRAAARPDLAEQIWAYAAGAFGQVRTVGGAATYAAGKWLAQRLASSTGGHQPFVAPHTVLNDPVRAPRALATLSLPLDTMTRIAHAANGKVNDVVLALVDEALHRYLDERDALPDERLVALVPMSLREPGDTKASNNATMLAVPMGGRGVSVVRRMEEIMAATASAKAEMRTLSPETSMMVSLAAFGFTELADATRLSGVTRPWGNVLVSNVAGPKEPLYLAGARLTGMYPISGVGMSTGLNFTLFSRAEAIDFGIVASRMSVPDLPDLAAHMHDAFKELAAALPRAGAVSRRKADGGRRRTAAG
jgi:diacylglycerol O-acyltransferase